MSTCLPVWGSRVSGFLGMRQEYRLPVQGHVTRSCLEARGQSPYPHAHHKNKLVGAEVASGVGGLKQHLLL